MKTYYIKCTHCGNRTQKLLQYINENKKLQHRLFCSRKCANLAKNTCVRQRCALCKKETLVRKSVLNRSKTKRFFCNKSCAATYNNQHKIYGTRRSKLEKYVEQYLVRDFSDLSFSFNNTQLIGAELDVVCEELKVAIEINGIVHYEPIYGADRLKRIVNRDKQKMLSCYEKGFELVVINAAAHKRVNDQTCATYYNQVKQILSDILQSPRK